MIEFKDISVRYGTQSILSNVTFRVNKGERIGFVGPNGSGKSTLFGLILGETSADHGSVTLEESPRIGHIRQHPSAESENETLLEYALRGAERVHEIEREIHLLEREVTQAGHAENRSRLLARLGELQTEFEHAGGYEYESRVKVALGGLGFAEEEFSHPFNSFSGGWRMRAELSRVLGAGMDLLLLDEPSNYLDLPAVEWLQRFLRGFEGTLLLISHDRFLLRTLTNITVEVDAGTATRYQGNLDFYLREREARHNAMQAARANQERRIEQLERFVRRFKAVASKAAQAQSRVKMIERIHSEMAPVPKRSLSAGFLRLAPPPHAGAEILRMEGVGFSYDGKHRVLHDVDLRIARGDKVAVVGYNGMGKTTLLRLMASAIQPTNGKVVLGHKVEPGYLSQELAETIPFELTVLDCARGSVARLPGKELRAQLAGFGFSADDLEKPVGVLSGGERIRLAFLRLFLKPHNLLLLDEPTTHLDLEGRATLERAVRAYEGTLCLVSHDVEFVRNTANAIIEITPAGVRRFPGGYDYYKEKTSEEPKPYDAGKTSGSAPARDRVPGLNARELRRARAAARARLQPAINKSRAKVSGLERRISALESELEELSKTLFNPQPDTDFASLNKRVKEVQDKLERKSASWEREAMALEELENENREQLQTLNG